jgi:hypothetical protein
MQLSSGAHSNTRFKNATPLVDVLRLSCERCVNAHVLHAHVSTDSRVRGATC